MQPKDTAIGQSESIGLKFDIAQANRGLCNLRFDDTNRRP